MFKNDDDDDGKRVHLWEANIVEEAGLGLGTCQEFVTCMIALLS